MSKLAHSNESTMIEIEIRNMIADPYISKNELFEYLNEAGIDDIGHISKPLQQDYMQWVFLEEESA